MRLLPTPNDNPVNAIYSPMAPETMFPEALARLLSSS
jgi:hypothetical protein